MKPNDGMCEAAGRDTESGREVDVPELGVRRLALRRRGRAREVDVGGGTGRHAAGSRGGFGELVARIMRGWKAGVAVVASALVLVPVALGRLRPKMETAEE